jgi:hypothetical protein
MDIKEIKKRHLTHSCCKRYRPETPDGSFGYCETCNVHDVWCAGIACELIELKPLYHLCIKTT